jgi:hypothetical protein
MNINYLIAPRTNGANAFKTHGREHENLCDLTALCGSCHGLFHGHLPPRPVVERIAPVIQIIERPAKQRRERPKDAPFIDPSLPEQIEAEMPGGELIELNTELINRARKNGTFTNATLNALGVKKDEMWSGWVKRLVGNVVARDQYRKALEGRFIYGQKRGK